MNDFTPPVPEPAPVSEGTADLVKRLRAVVPYAGRSNVAFLCHEAADHIERAPLPAGREAVEALREIKRHALTMGAPGQLTVPLGLSRIVRLCIDAGVNEKLPDLPAPSSEPPDQGCTLPPTGWWCSREPGHDGPCAARQFAALAPAGQVEGFPQPRRQDGKPPCGECHLRPGETCDICGAVRPAGQTEGKS